MSLVSKILFVVSCVPVLVSTLTFFSPLVYAVGDEQNSSQTETVTLQNPLVVNSLEDLIVAILNIFITLMIPIIVFFIILAGFKYVTAQGNPGQIEEATTTFTYAVIGGVLILAAVAIAEIIKNTVDSFSV
jgi:hypothetical protein